MSVIPDNQKYKLDTEFICYICNLVENNIKKKHKINRKVIVTELFSKLFNTNEKETLVLENIIDFLWNHKRIKKLKKSAYILASFLIGYQRKYYEVA